MRNMLARVSAWPNCPKVRAFRPISIAMAVVMGTAILLLLGATTSAPRGGVTQARNAPQRVVYVSYVDDPNDDRGLADFKRLDRALDGFRARATTSFTLEFVQVAVGGPLTIDAKMRDIVATRPAVIVATSGDVLEAAKRATQAIPILFVSHNDPVQAGHVRSIALPGVKRTGFTFYLPMLQKAIELLIDAYPDTASIGVLADSDMVAEPAMSRELAAARDAFGIDIELFAVDNKDQLREVLRSRAGSRIQAWYFPFGAALWHQREAALELMARTGKPALFNRTYLVRQGAPMSYEAQVVDPFRVWARQLLLILNGADAATIPVERPSRFELALNLATIERNEHLRPSKKVIQWANVLVPEAN